MTQLTELDYESIENAVLETARGRWFLGEHKKRHASIDTPAILDAIARLEKVMASINVGEPDRQQPDKVSAAPFTPATINIPSPATEAVKEAATEAAKEPDKAPVDQASQPSVDKLQFFKNDEDLFADDTSAFLSKTPVQENAQEVSPAPEPARERFKIFKKSSKDDQVDADQLEVEKKVPDPILHPTTQEQDRIIVIRNTSGEDITIPLADDFEDTPETDQSGANVR